MSPGAAARGASRPPPWRDVRVLRVAAQLAFLAAVVGLATYLWRTLLGNLQRQGISTGFGFLDGSAGFRIPDTDFRPSDSVARAILVGIKNTALVAGAGIVLATLVGVFAGTARLSRNWVVRTGVALYVEALRNVPVLVIIFFFYFAVILSLPAIGDAIEWFGVVVLSNSGLALPSPTLDRGAGAYWLVVAAALGAAFVVARWRVRRFDRTGEPHHRAAWTALTLLAVLAVGYLALGRPIGVDVPERGEFGATGGLRLNPEYAALLIALVLYTATHIAEIVRGAILAVPRGQSEAATALGLSDFQRLRHVVLPQALRIAVPPIANQYLNLTKNSSLAVAIGYAEVTRVTFIVISQGNPAPQAIVVLMLVYLTFSLTISAVMNVVNRRLRFATR